MVPYLNIFQSRIQNILISVRKQDEEGGRKDTKTKKMVSPNIISY